MTWKHIRARRAAKMPSAPPSATLRADLRSRRAAEWRGADESGPIGAAARNSAQSLHNGHFLYTRRPNHLTGGVQSLRKRSRPISRVLSRTIIHLRYASPRTSSDLPGSPCGPHARSVRKRTACSPIWSCSGRGLPCHRVLPPARCALTAPFHPYRPLCRGLAVCFLLHFPWARAPQALPGALPWEPGLSSTLARSDCLADSGRDGLTAPTSAPTSAQRRTGRCV